MRSSTSTVMKPAIIQVCAKINKGEGEFKHLSYSD